MASKVTDLDDEIKTELTGGLAAPAAPPPQPRKKSGPLSRPNSLRVLIGFAAILLIAVLGMYWYFSGRESTDDAQVDGHLNPIASKISGNVIQVLVNDNQAVKAGQVLVKIDPRDYQARVDQARAELDLAQARASGAEIVVPMTRSVTSSGASGASADLQSALAEQSRAELDFQMASSSKLAYARATVAKEQANYDQSHSDLERMKPLIAKAEISQLQYDGYVAAERVAQSNLDAAKQQLAGAEQGVSIAQAQLEAAKARVAQAHAGVEQASANTKQVAMRSADAAAAKAGIEQAKANLEAAQLQLSYATIVAPVDGVVTHKSVEVG
ncbi:MAG: HlyD family secretion protein [Bryobacteraceae bacterium]